jgi:enterochelin esterase-like enzyme
MRHVMVSPRRSSHIPIFSALVIVVFTWLLLACSSDSFPSEITPTLTAPQKIIPTVTKTGITPTPQIAVVTIQETPQQEQTCQEKSGRVQHYQVDSRIIRKSQQVNVYLPPCYDPQLDEGYPVLILLHGQGQDENFWVDAGIAEKSDYLIQSSQTGPFIVIMPYEEYNLEDILQSRFGDMLMEELVPWAESTFNLREGQHFRAIGGNSRGAYWAFRLAFKYRGNFGRVGIHSMPFFGEPNALRLWLKQIPPGEMPLISMDSGKGDRYLNDALEFEHLLDSYQVLHEWHLKEGQHDGVYWEENLEEYLSWYAQTWNE